MIITMDMRMNWYQALYAGVDGLRHKAVVKATSAEEAINYLSKQPHVKLVEGMATAHTYIEEQHIVWE
jgi:hypothetical protein